MKTSKQDRYVLATLCLGFGGCGAVIIICFLIGFGLDTFVGKEALYICFGLQALNLTLIRLRERKLRQEHTPAPSKRMLRLHSVFAWLWRAGALLLTIALLLGIFGVSFGDFWVRYPCMIGAAFTFLGWLGAVVSYHRRRQASLVIREQSKNR